MCETRHFSSPKGRPGETGVLHKAKLPAFMLVLCWAALISWANIPQGSSQPVPASRLTIQYRAGSFTLVSSASLLKVIPPSDQLPVTPLPVSGFWYELQSPQGEVVYRRIISDPITVYTEIPAPESSFVPERVEAPTAEAVLSILIPEIAGTNQLVLFSSPPGPVGKSQPATVVARIPVVSRAR